MERRRKSRISCDRIHAMSNSATLILASNSPRRRQLLALGGWQFVVQPADVDESRLPGEAPAAYVLRLAESKARTVAAQAGSEMLVVASDTSVVDGEEILGKPADAAEAAAMLRQLRGREHFVFTSLAVLRVQDGLLRTDLCRTRVPMREYTDDEIDVYVQSGDPMDKAGAYAIQHAGFHPVDRLEGCFASVMGLPLCHLTRMLTALDAPARANIPAACQESLEYICPIYAAVLRGEDIG